VEIAIKDVKEMFESPIVPSNRHEFFNDYNHMEFQSLLDKYYPVGTKEKLKNFARRVLNRIGIDRYMKRILQFLKKNRGNYGK